MTEHSPTRRAAVRILVAEDTPMFQRIFRECLEQLRTEVMVVADGAAALALLEADPMAFQLLVSDIEMPVLDGLELVRRMRAHAVLRALPAIACSSRAEPEHEARALAAGFDAYLVKFQEEQFKKAAALWLVRGARRQPETSPVGGA